MGNMNLCKKFEEASSLIKRDIVFVSSLYLEWIFLKFNLIIYIFL